MRSRPRVGIHTDSDYRIRSGIFYTLLQSVGEGHVYLRQEALLVRAGNLLGVQIEHIEKYLMDLAMEKKVVLKEGEDGVRVYASHYYYLELNTAKMLHDLNVRCETDEAALERRIHATEENAGLSLDEMQKESCGGSGRGRGSDDPDGRSGDWEDYHHQRHDPFLSKAREWKSCLAAPTGRAAKRMTEATGCEAQTIHRLLEVNRAIRRKRQTVASSEK